MTVQEKRLLLLLALAVALEIATVYRLYVQGEESKATLEGHEHRLKQLEGAKRSEPAPATATRARARARPMPPAQSPPRPAVVPPPPDLPGAAPQTT